jgi:hypothetical protein
MQLLFNGSLKWMIALAVMLVVLQCGCRRHSLQTEDLVIVNDETTLVRDALDKKIAPLIGGNQFDALDSMAGDLRASEIQTAMGTWHLLCFYDDICEIPEPASDQAYEERINFLQDWVSHKPQSITARVALARAYKYYAWHARGNGYADTVTPEAEQFFEKRLRQAAQVLQEARGLTEKCPVWWDTMHYVAIGLGWPMESYNKMFDEAIAFEPDYTFFYNNKAIYLLPRWYGHEGDWQKFASDSADNEGGESGDILYARIGWRIHQRRIYKSFIQDAGYSWPRMEKGLEAIVKSYPNSVSAANELAYLSYQEGDCVVARPLFEKIGNKVDYGVWNDDKARFLRARTWVFTH